MSVKWEKTGDSKGKLQFTISQEKIKSGMDQAFNKVKKDISVPGFRKGKVPRKVFNSMYGEGALYEEALNIVLPEVYAEALEEAEVEAVGQPQINVTSMESDQDWEIEAEVPVKPEVKLGQYK